MFERMLNEMDRMRRDMERFMERRPLPGWGDSEKSTDWSFTLPVETGWTDDHLNLRFIVPGVTDKDFTLTVQGNQLILRGERKEPKDFGKDDAVWHAIPYGKFERVIDLASGLNLDKLQATLHDGVLDVHIPLAAEIKPRKVEIQVGKEQKKLAAA